VRLRGEKTLSPFFIFNVVEFASKYCERDYYFDNRRFFIYICMYVCGRDSAFCSQFFFSSRFVRLKFCEFFFLSNFLRLSRFATRKKKKKSIFTHPSFFFLFFSYICIKIDCRNLSKNTFVRTIFSCWLCQRPLEKFSFSPLYPDVYIYIPPLL